MFSLVTPLPNWVTLGIHKLRNPGDRHHGYEAAAAEVRSGPW